MALISRSFHYSIDYHVQALPISLATTLGISVDFFSCSYLDVSVRRVRFAYLCIQYAMTLAGGFPHSEICGSKRVCSLPAAYRKLLRPSSPVIAKASTMCTYSLVPITLASLARDVIEHLSFAFAVSKELIAFYVENSLHTLMIDTITTHQRSPIRSSQTYQLTLINLYYFFQIVKEQNSQWSDKRPNPNPA